MTRTWKVVGLQTVLILGLAASPAAAQNNGSTFDPQKLDEIQQQLDKLRNDMHFSFQAAQKDMDALKEQITHLRKEMDALHDTRPPSTQISAYASPGAGTGNIRLINTYPEPVTVVLNGGSYKLFPGETRALTGQPAGSFTYEVLGVQQPVERTLAANATFTIQVHPR